jgi:hypothetical protein
MILRGFIMTYLALVIAASKLPAQIPAMQQPPTSAYPIEFENWLDSGDTKDRVERLAGLGVDRRVAEEFTSVEEVSLQWKPIKSVGSNKTALLVLPCAAGSDSAYLYALTSDGNTWRVTDSSDFDCHYDMEVAVGVESIRSPAFQEILVHRACTGHGTGFLKQDFEVFAVANGKLKLEFDTTEVLHSSPKANDARRDLDQNSVFVIVPVKQAVSRAIEETRSRTLDGRLTVDRRLLRWNSRKARYRPSKFARVMAGPA